MGLDLKLLPAYNNTDFSRECLMLERDEVLFELIKAAQVAFGYDAPRSGITTVLSDREIGYDSYHNRIKSLTASELHNAWRGYKPTDTKNAAIMAFVSLLPSDTIIWLYWC